MLSLDLLIKQEARKLIQSEKCYSKLMRYFVNSAFFIIYIFILPLFVLSAITLKYISGNRKIPSFLVHSLSFDDVYFLNNSDELLFQFLSEDRFPYSINSDDYLISIKGRRRQTLDLLKKTRDLSFHVFFYCLSKEELIRQLFFTYINCFKVLKNWDIANFRNFRLIRLVFDYSVWQSVNLPAPVTFITTQSVLDRLPIAFYLNKLNLIRHMIWYSTNNKPLDRVNSKATSFVEFDKLASFIDLHFVWNKNEAKFLLDRGVSKTSVVGSMVFYPKKLELSLQNKKIVTYFDITPYNKFDGFLSENMLASNLNGIKDAIDLLKDKSKTEIILQVKPKRIYYSAHSKTYIEQINRLSKNQEIILLPSKTDLYKLIQNSDVVIAVPFTSPALIAKELGVKVAFLCLLPRDYDLSQDDELIPVLTTLEELINFLS